MARRFEAASFQYVAYNTSTFALSTKATFFVRFRLASNTPNGSYRAIYSSFDTSGGDKRNLHVGFQGTAGGEKIRVEWTAGASTYITRSSADQTLSTGVWYSLCITVDWTTNPDTVAMTLNGSNLSLSLSGSNNTTPDSSGSMTIKWGAYGGADAEHFDGSLEGGAVWTDVLSDDEIASLHAGWSPAHFRPDKHGILLDRFDTHHDWVHAQPFIGGTTTYTDGPSNVIYLRQAARYAGLPTSSITVTGNGNSISDGSSEASSSNHTDFGSTALGVTVSRTFTITNSGSADLIISSVGLSGSGAGQFTVTADPTGTITAGNNATLTVRADAGSAGTHTATVTINSNAPGALAAFTFNIQVVVNSSRVVLIVQNHGAFL